MADPYRFDVFDRYRTLPSVRSRSNAWGAGTGATVYVTGRSTSPGDSFHDGTIAETGALVDRAGGTGVPVRVDHFGGGTPRSLRHELGGPPELHPSLR
ncbi:hypothetical protein GCM10027176_56320 [Actinoallomurus bryophytorum]